MTLVTLEMLQHIIFWINKEKFTRVGLEPATSGLTRRCSTN